MNWFTKLLKAKITVNIFISNSDDIKHTSVPQKTERSPLITKIVKSDFRFVSELKTDIDGNETLYYFTEQYDHTYKSWRMVSQSFGADKSKAMDVHLKLLDRGTLEPTVVKTIHWEGLSKEETEAWVLLNK